MFTTENSMEILKGIVNNPYVGMTILDENGVIIFRNKISEEISGIKNRDVLNKHFSIIPGKGELIEVLRTGKPKLGLTYTTKSGKKAIVHRFPLCSGDRIKGAMTIINFKDSDEMEEILQKYHLLKGKLQYYKRELQKVRLAKFSLSNIITNDNHMKYLKNLVKKYAKTNSPVFIFGETGTGKELFAHAIHLSSPRRHGPFIKVNCASIPDDLLESELFGYESGAFTGAKREGKIGKFELANGGTIFLDEIGSMGIEMQAKILRVLQEKELERLGSNRPVKLNFRTISATNKNLETLIKEEKFRLDLYYRLLVLSLDIPPLRKRKVDIDLLCNAFLKTFNKENGTQIKIIDEKAMNILLAWNWPGNVRELRNVIERAASMTENGVIKTGDLPPYLVKSSKLQDDIIHEAEEHNLLREAKINVEKKMLESTLLKTHGNISQSAKNLGISRPLLYSLIKKYGIRKPEWKVKLKSVP